jgi:hypothetical protein
VSLAEPTRRRGAGPGECRSVALSPLSDGHIDALLSLADHPAIHRAASVPAPCTRDWFAERLDDMRSNRPTAVTLHETLRRQTRSFNELHLHKT